jgi:hypothetical protein
MPVINCIYHPVHGMRVVQQDEYERLLATGVWFAHPTEAKNMRKDYEKQIHDERNGTRSGTTPKRSRKTTGPRAETGEEVLRVQREHDEQRCSNDSSSS